MNLIGLMVVKDEAWVIGASLRAALEWCDTVVVVDDGSTDGTTDIIHEIEKEHPFRIHYSRWTNRKKTGETIRREVTRYVDGKAVQSVETIECEVEDFDAPWAEMDVRQHSLEVGRRFNGTHFAIIDADEILTANWLKDVRCWFEQLEPRRCLDVQMIAPVDGLDEYRVENSEWTRSRITLGFRDDPSLCWKPRGPEGYHFHARAPQGSDQFRTIAPPKLGTGGIFHLQWANLARLRAKHAWYALTERARWNYPVSQINERYGQAPDLSGIMTRTVPAEWWGRHRRELIDVAGYPYSHIDRCKTLWRLHGPEKFAGLNLYGMERILG